MAKSNMMPAAVEITEPLLKIIKCISCGAERTRLTKKGYCKACVAAGKVTEKKRNALKERTAHFNKLREERMKQYHVYITRESELEKAIKAKMEKSDLTFSALALKAIAQYLRVPTPPEPKVGRPEFAPVEF